MAILYLHQRQSFTSWSAQVLTERDCNMLLFLQHLPSSIQSRRSLPGPNSQTSRRRSALKSAGPHRCRIVSEVRDSTTGGSKVSNYDDDGSRVIPVPLFVAATQEQIISGVYGVLDEYRNVVYVGMSRDVAASLVEHSERHAEHVCYVKVMTFKIPMVPEMKRVMESWILDTELIPQGNLEEWYELDEELAGQVRNAPTNSLSSVEKIVSPFEDDPLPARGSHKTLDLTAANVDLVLDEVRPYLIADGGNVSVENVEQTTGTVELLLEGACSACSSATTTMQLGIEKALRERFGDSLGEVVAVDTTKVANEPSTASCERALDTIRVMLRGLGGEVSVLDVDEDEVVLTFSGPNNLKFGIEQTLVQKVPGIQTVTFE